MSGAMYSFAQGGAGSSFDLPSTALPAARLDFLVNSLTTSAQRHDPVQDQRVLQLISQSNLLAQLPANEAQHKLVVRINALISAQNPLGYQLALLWLQQRPTIWNTLLVNHASTWTTQIFNLLASPDRLLAKRSAHTLLSSAMELLVLHIFSENVAGRQEFHRQVVSPNLPKVISGLTQLLQLLLSKEESDSTILNTTISYINRLLHLHPAQFRPVSSKLHDALIAFLYTSADVSVPLPIFVNAANLLTALHLTGSLASKGSEASGGQARITQAQLWHMSLSGHLRHARQAYAHAVSSYLDAPYPETSSSDSADPQSTASSNAAFNPYPKDQISASQVAYSRLETLLGSRGRPGLINLHLKAASPRPVPIPVGSLLNFASSILRIDYMSRHKPTAEAKLCTLQASHLPSLHTRALALITQLALVAPKAVALQSSKVLGELCRLVESNSPHVAGASPRIKVAAFRALQMMVGKEKGIGMHLDPAGRLTLRLARIVLSQIANAVLQPDSSIGASSSSATDTNGQSSTGGGGSRKANKKARLYESDSVFGSGLNPKDLIQRLSPEGIASTQSALQVLVSVFPHLTTGLSAQHFDLAHIGSQSVIAMVEILADSIPSSAGLFSSSQSQGGCKNAPPSTRDLFASSLKALSDLCMDAPSSMLATILPRVLPLLTRLSQAGPGDAAISASARQALSTVHTASKGKFIPIAKGVGFGPNSRDDFDDVPEGTKFPASVNHTIAPTSGDSLDSAVSSVLGRHVLHKRVRVEDENEEEEEEEANDARGFEARGLDIEAVTAESDELAHAQAQAQDQGSAMSTSTSSSGVAGASTAVYGGGLGHGHPPSPPRAGRSVDASQRVYSPDPVKPSLRPSTPRIGSPSSANQYPHSRQTSPSAGRSSTPVHSLAPLGSSSSSSVASGLGIEESRLGKEVFGGGGTHVESTTKATSTSQNVEPTNAATNNNINENNDNDPVVVKETTTTTTIETMQGFTQDNDDDDDDDEEMPPIDLADSDEDEEEDQNNDDGNGVI